MSESSDPRQRIGVDDEGRPQLQNVGDLIQMATWCFESGFLPNHIKNAKQAFAIMQYGAQIGLPPFPAWRFIYQTKGGKLAIETKGALAVVQSKPTYEDYQERIEGTGEEMRAVAVAQRKGHKPVIKEFSYADARAAGLTRRPKTREGREYDGPWQAYLKDMLLSKARERALGIAFAAELGGIPIEGVAEEIEARQSQRAGAARDLKKHMRVVEGEVARALPEGKPRETLVDLIRGKDVQVVETPPPEERRVSAYNPEGVEIGYTEEVVKEAPPADPIEQVISDQVDEALGDGPSSVTCEGCGTMYHIDREGCPECGVAKGEGPPPAEAPPEPEPEPEGSPFAQALRRKAKTRQAQMFQDEE